MSSLERELKSPFTRVDWARVGIALNSAMRDKLEEHIKRDVYDAYTPIEYIRRSKKPSMGTPLTDMDVNSSIHAGLDAGGTFTFQFRYHPTGIHDNVMWSDESGDGLIGRIEKFEPPYNWTPKRKTLNERPFWQEFVEDMVDNGGIANVLAQTLSGLGYETNPGTVTRTPDDGRY